MSEVSIQEFLDAYHTWRGFTGWARNMNAMVQYKTAFLGIGERDGASNLSEEAINRIKWMNGPNAKTLYKIWVAQNDTA